MQHEAALLAMGVITHAAEGRAELPQAQNIFHAVQYLDKRMVRVPSAGWPDGCAGGMTVIMCAHPDRLLADCSLFGWLLAGCWQLAVRLAARC